MFLLLKKFKNSALQASFVDINDILNWVFFVLIFKIYEYFGLKQLVMSLEL